MSSWTTEPLFCHCQTFLKVVPEGCVCSSKEFGIFMFSGMPIILHSFALSFSCPYICIRTIGWPRIRNGEVSILGMEGWDGRTAWLGALLTNLRWTLRFALVARDIVILIPTTTGKVEGHAFVTVTGKVPARLLGLAVTHIRWQATARWIVGDLGCAVVC